MNVRVRFSDDQLRLFWQFGEDPAFHETPAWRRAGFAAGNRVADIGCGPGAVTVRLAQLVGPNGTVVAVDRDPQHLPAVQALSDACGATNVELVQAEASDTGLEPASFDAIMLRHVLIHNGGTASAILEHLASLLRPGGKLFLCEVDLSGVHYEGTPPPYLDLHDCYLRFMAAQGGDLALGPQLAPMLAAAGLSVTDRLAWVRIYDHSTGIPPTAIARGDEMVATGAATASQLVLWKKIHETRADGKIPTFVYAPIYCAVGTMAAE